MADVVQLVRASVCGTECRRFESGRSPHVTLWASSSVGRAVDS